MPTDIKVESYSSTRCASLRWGLEDFEYEDDLIEFSDMELPYGAQCHLSIYPKMTLDDETYVTVYMFCEAAIELRYRVSIVNEDGERCYSKEYQYRFGDGDERCLGNFIKRDDLLNEDNEYLVNGMLHILVEVAVIENWSRSTTSTTTGPINEKPLTDLRSLLESAKLCDIVLSVSGKDLQAHKAILSARSPVFEAMFSNEQYLEKSQNKVDIPDVSSEAFELLLLGIYSGKLSLLEEHAQELLMATDKYQVEDLKAQCVQYLCSHVTVDNATELLLLADLHHANELKTQCIKYIATNWAEVIATEGWAKLKTSSANHNLLLLELCEALCKMH